MEKTGSSVILLQNEEQILERRPGLSSFGTWYQLLFQSKTTHS